MQSAPVSCWFYPTFWTLSWLSVFVSPVTEPWSLWRSPCRHKGSPCWERRAPLRSAARCWVKTPRFSPTQTGRFLVPLPTRSTVAVSWFCSVKSVQILSISPRCSRTGESLRERRAAPGSAPPVKPGSHPRRSCAWTCPTPASLRDKPTLKLYSPLPPSLRLIPVSHCRSKPVKVSWCRELFRWSEKYDQNRNILWKVMD